MRIPSGVMVTGWRRPTRFMESMSSVRSPGSRRWRSPMTMEATLRSSSMWPRSDMTFVRLLRRRVDRRNRFAPIGQDVIVEQVVQILTGAQPQQDATPAIGLDEVAVRVAEHRPQHREPPVLVESEPAGAVAVAAQRGIRLPGVATPVQTRRDVLQ